MAEVGCLKDGNFQNLQVEVDSLKNIVNLQNKLIYIHKEVIFSDSTLTLKLEEKIDVLENDVKLLEKKTKKYVIT